MDTARSNSRMFTLVNGTVGCSLFLVWIISSSLLLCLVPLSTYAKTVEELEAEQKTCLAEWAKIFATYEKAHDPQNILRLRAECEKYRHLMSKAFAKLRPFQAGDDWIRKKEIECEDLDKRSAIAYEKLNAPVIIGYTPDKGAIFGNRPRSPEEEQRLRTAYTNAHGASMDCSMSLYREKERQQRHAAERSQLEASYKTYTDELKHCEDGLRYIELGLPNQLRFWAEKCADLDKRLAAARANLQQQQRQQQTALRMRGPATASEGQSITFSAEVPQNISANLLNVQWTGGFTWLLDGRELPGTNSSVTFTAPGKGVHSITAQFWTRRGQSPSTQTLAQGGASFTVAAKQSDNQQNASLDCVGTTKARTPERKSCCERKYPDEYNRRFCEKMMKMDPHEAELLHKSFSR